MIMIIIIIIIITIIIIIPNGHNFHNTTTKKLHKYTYEGWNFNSGNYLFTADTK